MALNQIKVTHIADVHLEKRMNKLFGDGRKQEERREEIWKIFEKTLELASLNSQILLIAGDLYERDYFDYKDIIRLYSIISRHPKLKVLLSFGNHDFLDKSLLLSVEKPENLYLFLNDELDYFEFSDINTRVYGVSWIKANYQEKIFNFELDKSYHNILILHGVIGQNSEAYMYFDKENILNAGFSYIAMGHIHRYINIMNKIVYSGPLEGQKFSDESYGGYVEAVISKDYNDVSYIPRARRKFIKTSITIDPSMSIIDIYNKIIEVTDLENFYRLNLTGSIELGTYSRLSEILEDIKSRLYYIEYQDDLTIIDSDIVESKTIKDIIDIIINSDGKEDIKQKAIVKVLNRMLGD